jgi:hypothetical protein
MKLGQNFKISLPDHISVMNITAAVSIGALTVAAYLMVTEPFQNYDTVDAVSEAKEQMLQPGDLPEPLHNEADLKADFTETESVPKADDNDKSITEHAVSESADELKVVTNSSKYTSDGMVMIDDIESFDASCYDGNLVFNWITSGKPNNQFEIEKSYDNETFEVFSIAPQPQATEDGKNHYSVEEYIGTEEVAFYRLRKKINKKKYEYSDEIRISCTTKKPDITDIDVFPNGYGSFRILIGTKTVDTFTVTLYDTEDMELATDRYVTQPGENEFVLTSNSISRGEYSLKVTNGQITKEKRVLLK